MTLSFIKTDGAGNDLVLVDLRNSMLSDPPGAAVRICDRHFGIGGDGVLTMERAEDADAFVRMFNPDGTEDFCGNGMRCVAAFLAAERGGRAEALVLCSPRGLHRANATRIAPRCYEVDVELVPPAFAPQDVPIKLAGAQVVDHLIEVAGEAVRISCVAVGTTHTAIFSDVDVDEARFLRLSSLIERHPVFPKRTSVLWCRAESPSLIRMRIWERGVGETQSCGTGACAAVVLGRRLGLTGDDAAVISSGGRMRAIWPGHGPVRLIGPARIVYRGKWIENDGGAA